MALSIPYVVVTILLDIAHPFPKDINVAFPTSLIFYPSIGLLVEILFHVIPLALILFPLRFVFKTVNSSKLSWLAIIIVSSLEPTYQIAYLRDDAMIFIIAVWVNLYLFNLTQLYFFKTADFITMFGIRLLYYLIWHIAWAEIRLALLF